MIPVADAKATCCKHLQVLLVRVLFEVSDVDLLSNFELMKMYVCGCMQNDPGTVGSHRAAGLCSSAPC